MTISRASASRRRFLTAFAAALGTAPAAALAQALRPLTIGFVPSTLFAPVFVAAERGYLRAAGFEATLAPIVAGQDAMVLLAAGRLDAAAAGISAAFYNAVGLALDVRFVASTGYQPKTGHPTALMMRQDLYEAGLHDPAALRGRKVGWLGGPSATAGYYVARILRPYHLTLADISAVNLPAPDQPAALEHQAVDAVFASAPLTGLFEQRHQATIIGSVTPGISCTGIFLGTTLLGDRAAAAAFLRACRRGAADVAGAGYYAPDNLAAMAKYAAQPVELIRTTDRYDFLPDLRIDAPTVVDMQRAYGAEGVLTYATPFDEAHLIARF